VFGNGIDKGMEQAIVNICCIVFGVCVGRIDIDLILYIQKRRSEQDGTRTICVVYL
jgi:hypothetical protein